MNSAKAKSTIEKLHRLAINNGAFAGESINAATKAIFLIKKHGLSEDGEFTTILIDLNAILTPTPKAKAKAKAKVNRSAGIWGCCTAETQAVAKAIIRAGARGTTMKNIKGVTGLRNTYHCLCDKLAAKGYIAIAKHGRTKIFTATAKGLAAAKG